jgi:tripartite ATP-independent transporter DctM subunit
VRRQPVKVYPRASWRERGKALADGLWALAMPAMILAGIRFGVVTPTEAAVLAAVYAMLVGLFVYRELKFSQLYRVFLLAAKTTAVVMFLVASALVSAWLITQANIPGELGSLLEPFREHPKLLLVLMMLLVLVVGTALDFAPTVLILTPVLMPIAKQAGIDPVYFGVLFIMNNAIGLLTPPVGIVLNVVAGVARVPMGAVISGVMPFLLAQTVVMFLLVAFPELVTVPLAWLRGR